MRAVVVRENGGIEKLVVDDTTRPEPADGELVVDVAVAGVNYLDLYHRQGALAAPFIAGVEGVGTVAAAGSNLSAALVGNRVGWLNAQGSYADAVALPVHSAIPIPADIDDDDAAALLMQGITAQYLASSIVEIGLDTVAVVHSAAGGVGRLLTQILAHLGATVIATASTEAKRESALAAGAHAAVVYDELAATVADVTGGSGAAVVFDGVGRDTVAVSLEVLAVRGTLVCIGASSGQPKPIALSELAVRSLSVIRPSVAHYTADRVELLRRAEQVFDWFRAGVLTVKIAQRYPLDDAARAQEDLASRRQSGKLLLTVAGTLANPA